MVVTLSQQYNTGEKSTVMLCTYINRHAGTPDKNKTNTHSRKWGFVKKGYASLFLGQKGAHLESEKMKQ